MQLAEAREISTLKQHLSSPIHQLYIGFKVHKPLIIASEGILLSRDVILVSSGDSREACMHIVSHFHYLVDSNILWQQPIHLISQLVAIKHLFSIEVSNHHFSMNPRISTSGTCHRNIFSQKRPNRLVETLLHTRPVWLNLPSVVIATVIIQINEVSLHVS